MNDWVHYLIITVNLKIKREKFHFNLNNFQQRKTTKTLE